MATYRLMDGASGRPGVGSSVQTPPSSPVATTIAIVLAAPFIVDEGGCWLEGFNLWVPGTNGSTVAQEFCAWQSMGNSGGYQGILNDSTIESGTLVAGEFNYIALPTPLNLTPNMWYQAQTGMSTTSPSGFPDTQNMFGSGNPYAAGISNGPLSMLGDTGWPVWLPQGAQNYATGISDPTAAFATQVASHNDLLWLDPQITTVAPVGATYCGFPNLPGGYVPTGTSQDQEGVYTVGLEFWVTQPCQFQRVRFFSPPGASVLPSWSGLWNATTQTLVASHASPNWKVEATGSAASAGAGWIYDDYSTSDIVLATGPGTRYKSSAFGDDPSTNWFSANGSMFGTGQTWASNIVNGPLVVPSWANSLIGQDSWNTSGTPTYPNTSNASNQGEFDGIDAVVLPVTVSSSGLLLASFI